MLVVAVEEGGGWLSSAARHSSACRAACRTRSRVAPFSACGSDDISKSGGLLRDLPPCQTTRSHSTYVARSTRHISSLPIYLASPYCSGTMVQCSGIACQCRGPSQPCTRKHKGRHRARGLVRSYPTLRHSPRKWDHRNSTYATQLTVRSDSAHLVRLLLLSIATTDVTHGCTPVGSHAALRLSSLHIGRYPTVSRVRGDEHGTLLPSTTGIDLYKVYDKGGATTVSSQRSCASGSVRLCLPGTRLVSSCMFVRSRDSAILSSKAVFTPDSQGQKRHYHGKSLLNTTYEASRARHWVA